MGGMAFLIWGDVAEDRLQPVPVKRNIFDRILGRTRYQGPQVTDLGQGMKLFDLPCGDLDKLIGDFRTFLTERLSDPWEASKVFLDYASPSVMSIFVRGEQNSERARPDWYVQLTFSGCAGTAEISAEVGSHWAEIWYKDRREKITRDFLYPYGFAPDNSRTEDGPARTFLPLGRLGYGMYVGNQTSDLDSEFPGSKLFELDAYLVEEFIPENDLGRLAELDDVCGPLMTDNKCRCQLCMPEFDPASIRGLSFKI